MNGYVLRWYSGYKKLGQAFIHKDSGLMQFTYPGLLDSKELAVKSVYIPEKMLRIIDKAATTNRGRDSSPSTEYNSSRSRSI